MKPHNILVMQLARLGDLVQTWPLLRRLRALYPQARLSLLSDQALEPLQALGPPVDAFCGLAFQDLAALTHQDLPSAYQRLQGHLQELRAHHFDLVFNLNFSRLSLLLTYLLGVQARGYHPLDGGRSYGRDPWLAYIFSLVHHRRLNRFHLSDVFRHLAPPISAEPGVPPARTVQHQGEPVIAFQLGTRHPKRTWPLPAFARLASTLISRLGARIWLLGTKGEHHLGQSLIKGLSVPQQDRVTNLQGQTSLAELASCLQEVHYLVSGDTGTLHLAAALGTPTLAIFFGPASCFETGPYGLGHYVLQAEPPCHPCLEAEASCSEPFCPAMLPPEAVARLLEALLTLGQPPRHPKLPVNTRFYYSGADHLGVTYQSLGNRPPDFFHLVGQAYRQAGGALLGLTPSFPDFQAQPPTTSTQRQIAALLACLQTCGHDFEISVEVANALKPLAAFQAQLQGQTTPRQASRWFTQVHNHLSKCLAVSLEPPALAAIEANSFVGEGHDLARNYC